MTGVGTTKIKFGKWSGVTKATAIAGIIAFMAMMLARPDFYLDSARRGLALYATNVLPSLFPFYFCSLLLTYMGAARAISGVFKRPVRLLFGAPKESAYILLMSMLSGYPVGASMTAELYDAGVIDAREAKTICAFASTSGPIFMLGTVGSAIFGDMRVGAVILAAHYLAAIINGVIFRLRKPRTKNNGFAAFKNSRVPADENNNFPAAKINRVLTSKNNGVVFSSRKPHAKSNRFTADENNRIPTNAADADCLIPKGEREYFAQKSNISQNADDDRPLAKGGRERSAPKNNGAQNVDVDNLLAKTIANSTLSMLYVGGYIVLCGMLADTLQLVGISSLIISALGERAGEPLVAAMMGAMEMTRGCLAAAGISNLRLAVALCAGIISLGGLSVTLQNYTFLSRCGIKLWEILLRKICHLLLASTLGYLFAMLL